TIRTRGAQRPTAPWHASSPGRRGSIPCAGRQESCERVERKSEGDDAEGARPGAGGPLPGARLVAARGGRELGRGERDRAEPRPAAAELRRGGARVAGRLYPSPRPPAAARRPTHRRSLRADRRRTTPTGGEARGPRGRAGHRAGGAA